MKTEMFGPVTWSINSRSVLEKALGNWNRLFQESTALSNVEEAKATRKAVILVPFESSEDSMKAAKVALSIARHTEGQLVLCYALFPKVIPFGPANPPWVNMALRDEALEKMKPVLRSQRKQP